MTKLDKLIQELCPDGIEYRCLKDSVSIMRGTRVVKNQLMETGEYPVFQNCLTPMGYYNKFNCKENTVFIIVAGAAGEIGYSSTDFWAADDCFCLICPPNLESRFLYHNLLSQHNFILSKVRRASIPRLARDVVENLSIPVPPLPVQREIVRILDNFTEHITELTEQLNLELTARKKQYEFYRNQLLTFDAQGATILTDRQTDKPNALNRLYQYVSEFIFVKLNDISVNCDSLRKPVTSGNREAGNIPYYGASGIVDYVKDYIFDGDYLLISEDGANLLARNTPIAFSISGKNWVNNHAHILRFNNRITQRYVEIYLNSIDLSPYISGGAQPKLNQQNLYKIPIPLPSYQKQKEIVTILDRFDTLCTDLSSGLPAEIEARQKQYEYYRDKLLTFKTMSN